MKSVRFIGILIVLLVAVGTASADVVITEANGIHPGSIQVYVTYNSNSTITFLDQSAGINNPGIAGIAYNLNIDAQQITGYKINSDTGQVLYNANSQDGNRWMKKTNPSAESESGNLLRFYSGDTGSTDRFHKIVVKLPSFDGNIPANTKNNQVGIQFVCDQFTDLIAGPGNSGIAGSGNSGIAGSGNSGIAGSENGGIAGSGNSGIMTGNSALSLEKTALSETYDTAGQKISYNYVVKNTGNVPITGITVQDNKLGTVSVPSTSLEPGQIISVAAFYTISQADLDAGSVTNTAYATGIYNSNIIQSNQAIVTVTADKPVLKLEESALPATYDASGQTIIYTYKVTNSGDVEIAGPIVVADNRINKGIPFEISKNDLSVGDQVVYTKDYTITDGDLSEGSVTNTAYATGAYSGKEVKSNDATATITPYKLPLTIVESASPTSYSTEGQKISYKYVVKNTGNVPITGIKVTDEKLGTVAAPSTALEPDTSITVSSTYTITQADIHEGSVTNLASATGTSNGKEIVSNTDAVTLKADVYIPEFPSIILPVMAILGLFFISQRRRNGK